MIWIRDGDFEIKVFVEEYKFFFKCVKDIFVLDVDSFRFVGFVKKDFWFIVIFIRWDGNFFIFVWDSKIIFLVNVF